jgi:hypothetical protein
MYVRSAAPAVARDTATFEGGESIVSAITSYGPRIIFQNSIHDAVAGIVERGLAKFPLWGGI